MSYLTQDMGWKLIQVINYFNRNDALLYNCELSYLLIHLLPLIINSKQFQNFDINSDTKTISMPNNCKTFHSSLDCFQTISFIQFKFNFDEVLSPAKVKSWVKSNKKSSDKFQSTISREVSDTDDSESKLYNIHLNKTPLIRISDIKISDNILSSFGSNNEIDDELVEENPITSDGLKEEKSQQLHKPNTIELFSCIVEILTQFAIYEQLYLKQDNDSEVYKLVPRVSYCVVEQLCDSLFSLYKLINNDNCYLLPVISSAKSLIFISCCTLSKTASGIKLFENIKLLERLLEIMQYLWRLRHNDANKEVCDLFNGLIYLFTSISQYLNSSKEYAIVLKLIRLFTTVGANELLSLIVSSQVTDMSDIKSIVSALQQLIIALQRAKVLYVHRTNCIRKRHSKCNLSAIVIHHNNILGTQLSHSTSNKFPFCCISSVYNLLISVLFHSKSESIQSFVCFNLNSVITCCCDLRYVFESLLRFSVNIESVVIRKDILKIIEYNIKAQKKHNYQSCESCERLSLRDKSNNFKDSSFSEGYITDYGGNDESKELLNEGFSAQYKLLLNSEDPMIRQLVSKHLWNLIHYCNESMRSTLFQFVIMPAFFCKDTPKDVMELLLRLLGSSVSDTSIAKMFINFGGLTNLRELLRNFDNSLLAINVLEVLVINETESYLNINQSETTFEETYPSLSTFLDIICEDTDKCILQIKHSLIDKPINSLNSSRDSINLLNEDQSFDNISEHTPNKLIDYLCYISNLWCINLKLVNISAEYSDFIKNPSIHLIDSMYRFFLIALDVLVKEITDFNSSIKGDSFREIPSDWINSLISIIELLLPVCLQLCPFRLSLCEKLIDKNEIISLLKHQINDLQQYSYKCEKNPIIQLLNMLINCSLNISQVSNTISPTFAKTKKKSFYPKDSLNNSSKDSTEEEDCVDSGYDADIECSQLNNSLFSLMNNIKNNNNVTHLKNVPLFKYGELCQIVIEFLTSHKDSLENQINLHNISSIIMKLVKYCRENIKNREILYRINFTSLLLTGFNTVLKTGSMELRAVQSAILDLFVEISHYKISSIELKLFFDLFKENNSQLDLCLNALYQLLSIKSSEHNLQPLYSLSFPLEPIMLCSLDSKSPIMSSEIGRIRHNIVYDSSTKPNHISWSSMAFAMPLPKSGNPLISSIKTFSVVFWLYFDKEILYTKISTQQNAINSEEKLNHNYYSNFTVNQNTNFNKNQDFRAHIMSFAFDLSTIEIWFDFHYYCFVYRICKMINGKNVIYTEDVHSNMGHILGKWHLLRFNFKEVFLKRSSTSLCISLSIDGMPEQQIKLNYSNVIPKHPNSTSVLLGTVQNKSFRWKCGNLMLFRNSLSLESTLYLYCLGSDFSCFSHCKLNDKNSFIIPKCLTDLNFIDVLPNIFQLYDSDKSRTLEENIVLVYKPIKMNQFLVYPNQLVANVSYLPNFNKLSFNSMRFISNASQSSDSQITEHKIIEFGEMKKDFNYGIHKAISDAGGIGIFMFLFAHIIDTSNDEKLQSKSLEILLKVYNSHVQHRDKFINQYEGLSLIAFVLENPKAIISLSMLRNFIQFSTSNCETDAVITSSEGIATLITSWKAWHRNSGTAKAFYQILVSLISSSNPYKNFNIFQMQRANVLQSLLLMFQEMYVHLNSRQDLHLSKESSLLVFKIMKTLIGKPPDISLLSEVFDCILLLHKAESAFISQSRNSFYYLFPSVWNFDSQSSSSRRTSIINVENIDVDDWEIISDEDLSTNEDIEDDCIDHLLSGLISLIGETVEYISDEVIDKVVGPIIKLEYLIVLANNKSFFVRESVMSTLYTCLKRCKSKEVTNHFIKTKGFHLLSNQLHKYPSSQKLIDICFGIILEVPDLCRFTLEDSMEFKKIFSSSQTDLFVPLFAVLPKCTHDICLSHNALQTFYRIITSLNTTILKDLYDFGLLECLSKVIINHNSYEQDSQVDTIDGYEEDLINEDILYILREFSTQFFCSSGTHNYQIFCNALQFYSVIERKVVSINKLSFRECQIALFEAAYDCIQSIAEEAVNIPHKSSKIAIGMCLVFSQSKFYQSKY
jgi:hypothetical protein